MAELCPLCQHPLGNLATYFKPIDGKLHEVHDRCPA